MVTRLVALAALIAAGAVLGLLARRPGRSRAVDARSGEVVDLGAVLGSTATLLQFSTATCAPCRAVRRVLAELASTRPGVLHVELDAEQRLDLVRRHRVLATPTVLVLDAHGRVRHRLTGVPDRSTLAHALDAASSTPAQRPALTVVEDRRA